MVLGVLRACRAQGFEADCALGVRGARGGREGGGEDVKRLPANLFGGQCHPDCRLDGGGRGCGRHFVINVVVVVYSGSMWKCLVMSGEYELCDLRKKKLRQGKIGI